MRPIMKYTMCAFAAAAISAPAFPAQVDYFLKLGNIKGESTKGAKGEQIEIMSYSWGATQTGSWDQMTLKGSKVGENAATGGVRVAAGDVNADGRADIITSPRDAASGLPTGKRQHKPLAVTMPLDRGSVTVKGKFPGCAVGTHYADAVLRTPAARYEFKDAIITNCAMPSMSGGGNDRPMESISFNYGKIETVYSPASKTKAKVDVRGWDPATKQ